ncbi:MAG TPA: hypothetical protein VH480_08740 [Streptosporangiaceae bacterium]
MSPERQPSSWSIDAAFWQKSLRFKVGVLVVGFLVLWGILTLLTALVN